MSELSVDELAAALSAAMPKLGASDQELALALIRRLALGAAVAAPDLAAALELPPTQVDQTLAKLPAVYRDEHARVVGFAGLTVVEMGQHRLYVDGRELSAWCAWDTLFLPELIGAGAHVTSRAPDSDEAISMTVTADGVVDLQPEQAVVSFLLPSSEFDEDVIKRFCHFVHFFPAPEAGAEWTAEHPGTFLLSVDDAYRLGRLTNRATFGDALAAARR